MDFSPSFEFDGNQPVTLKSEIPIDEVNPLDYLESIKDEEVDDE